MKKKLLYLMIAMGAYSSLFSMEESQENWVFIKDMPGATSKKESPGDDWRIKDGKLELNLNAPETMTQRPFIELIKEEKDKNLPFILVKILSGDQSQFMHFFDGSVITTLMSGWKMTGILTDPLNKQKIMNIELYIAGNDGKLRLLKDDVDTDYLGKFVTYEGHREEIVYPFRAYYVYKFIPVLTVPGLAQIFIAHLYEDQSYQIMKKNIQKRVNLKEMLEKLEQVGNLEEQVKNLSKQLSDLQQQKNKILSDMESSKNLDNEIKNIETKINDITIEIRLIEKPYEDPKAEKLLQLERLWLSWSLDKFGPENELQKQRASDRMKEIENKPEYLQD